MRTLRNIALLLAPLVLFAGAACGGDETTASTESNAPTTSSAAQSSADQSSTEQNTGSESAATQVAIKDFAFSPARIEIAAGTEVTWTNNDKFVHTVTSGATDGPENVPDGMFDENLADESSKASVTFEKAGTFTYYCKQHNAMDGTITVT